MDEPDLDAAPKSHGSHQPSGPAVEHGPNGTVVGGPEDGSQAPEAETTSEAEVSAPTVASSLRDALSALAAKQQRDPITKRFVPGSLASGKTLARSEQFWAAVEPAKRELVERVRADLAVDGDSVETLLGLIDGYAEARLFRMSMFLRLIDQGGPITARGKAKGLYRAYLDALDRETKLAQVLGLERRTKRVPSLAEVMSE